MWGLREVGWSSLQPWDEVPAATSPGGGRSMVFEGEDTSGDHRFPPQSKATSLSEAGRATGGAV